MDTDQETLDVAEAVDAAEPEQRTQEAAGDEAAELHEAAHRVKPSVEALLFVASEPLDPRKLAKLTGEDEKAIALAIVSLQDDYAGRGIVLREVAGGYRFATSPLARPSVEAYLLPPKSTLSTPALETLAIVAHMQPVTKSEVEAIRGVNSDSVVNTLLDRGLIGEAGRKDVVGRPMQYKTTPFFLESFGLNSIDDLPQLELDPGQPLELNLLLPAQAELPEPKGEENEPEAEPEAVSEEVAAEPS